MSIEGEDFTVACVDSRFDVHSANRPLKKCNSNLGPRKRKKSALARLLACFHHATKIVSIAANPYIVANEM